jgi:hypothetical protein
MHHTTQHHATLVTITINISMLYTTAFITSRSSAAILRRSFHWTKRLDASLGGTITSFRTTTPSSGVDMSTFDGSPNIEFKIRQQFTAPPGGIDTSIDSTGRFVWSTTVCLLERIQRDMLYTEEGAAASQPERLQVLELGSGCGLLGMGLAATGLVDVVLTDHPHAMEWLSSNVELNRDIVREHARVAPLEWANDQHAMQLEAQLTRPFDLIVGSDILYDHATHANLVETMRRFAQPANAAPIYLAYPKRSDEDPFLEAAREHFHVQVEPLDVNGSSGKHSLAILSCIE